MVEVEKNPSSGLTLQGVETHAVALPAECTDDRSVVPLTNTGAGGVLGTPGAGGEGAERAEALRLRSSAGDAAYAAPACRQVVRSEPRRGARDDCDAMQTGVGTGSKHNTPTSASEEPTHLLALNGTTQTTGVASVAAATDVGDGDVGGVVTVIDPNTLQQNHVEIPCVTTP